MQIKTKKSFNNLIKKLTLEVIEEEDIDEITSTGNVDGYGTPFAFSDGSKKAKKKKKKYSTNSTGYEMVNEALDKQDLEQIKKVVRLLVNDILRDIWLKRTAWNKI